MDTDEVLFREEEGKLSDPEMHGELSRRGFGREVRLGHSLEARPVQLPGGGEWHFVEDDYFLGRLVADPGARELDQLLAGRALASPR